MYAVIETGGKQVKCEVGQEIYVEKIDVEAGKTYTFDKVLMVADKTLKIGNPYVAGAKVVAECVKQGRGKKILVFKYEPKKQFHRTKGHRQAYTKFVIKSIDAEAKASTKAKVEEVKEVKVVEEVKAAPKAAATKPAAPKTTAPKTTTAKAAAPKTTAAKTTATKSTTAKTTTAKKAAPKAE